MEDSDMDYAPPPLLSIADDGGGREQESLDHRYASILMALMSDEQPAQAAVEAFHAACSEEVQGIRERSSAMLHRATRYFSLRQLADVLELQASTWLLIRWLYCMGNQPAGLGGALGPGTGDRKTYGQLAREAVMQSPELSRCAFVIAWLEHLAAQRLPAGLGSQFYRTDGLWQQSLLGRRAQPAAGGLSSAPALELDPDTVTRGTRLAEDDRQRQEKLAAQLWCMLRAGQLPRARVLCRQVGASWRAVSLGGAGGWGPLPVGTAAEELDQQVEGEEVLAQLGWEVEEGVPAARQRWRWACYQAARLAAEEGAAGSRYEAALYGALSSCVSAMLPVCATWEDEVWAYCRAWLDLSADEAVAGAVGQQQQMVEAGMADAAAEAAAEQIWDRPQDWRLPGGGQELEQEDMVSPELLRDCLVKLNNNYSHHAQVSVLAEGCSLSSKWPLQGLWTLVPRSFQELATRLANSGTSAVREAASLPEHSLQLQLIAEQWEQLMLSLTSAGLKAAEQLALEGADVEGAEEEGDAAADPGREANWATLRHTAHVALMLRGLGLLREPDALGMEGCDGEQYNLLRYQRHVSKLVYLYASTLITRVTDQAQAGQLLWVPRYLVHLPQDQREDLLQQLLAAAGDWLSDEQCLQVMHELMQVLGRWQVRQGQLAQLLQAGGLPGLGDMLTVRDQEGGQSVALGNHLYGDLREEECRQLLFTLLQRARSTAATTPTERLQLLRFMVYPYFLQLGNAAAAAGAGTSAGLTPEGVQLAAAVAASRVQLGGLDVTPGVAVQAVAGGLVAADGSWQDGVLQALGLVCELAWSSGPLSPVVEHMFTYILPGSFPAAAAAAAAAGAASAEADMELDAAIDQRVASALLVWQQYAELARRYRVWKAAAQAAIAAADGVVVAAGVAEVVEEGRSIAAGMLDLAQQDGLLGVVPGAAAARLGPGAGWEELEQVLVELQDASSVRLVLTTAPVAAGVEGKDGMDTEEQQQAEEGAQDVFNAPYTPLMRHQATRLKQQLEAALAASGATPGVTTSFALGHPVMQVIHNPQLPQLQDEGYCAVFVDLAVEQQLPTLEELAAAPGDALRALRTAAAGVQRMCQTAALLLSCGRLQGVGGPGAATKAPRVSCISMVGSLGCCLSVSRHRMMSKLLLRTGKVVLRLAQLDAESHMDLLGQLVTWTAGSPTAPANNSSSQAVGGLLGALSAPEVRVLVQRVQQVLEVAPLL